MFLNYRFYNQKRATNVIWVIYLSKMIKIYNFGLHVLKYRDGFCLISIQIHMYICLFFHLDFSYLVKLNGYWSMSPSDVKSGGFIMYTMIINSAPVNTSQHPCFVFPSHGISMETSFKIKCEDGGIVDPDIPLLYQWFYRTNSSGTWKSITYPSDGNILLKVQTILWCTPREWESQG